MIISTAEVITRLGKEPQSQSSRKRLLNLALSATLSRNITAITVSIANPDDDQGHQEYRLTIQN